MAKYLYNGIELPALPEWDKTAFPYVYIYHTTPIIKTIYNVHFTSSPYYGTSSRGEHCIGRRVGDISYSWMEGYTDWVIDEVSPWSSEGVLAPLNENLRWSNFDILNADGSVYLPASYPIDAETGEEIHDYEIGGKPVTTAPIPADFYIKKGGKVYKVSGGVTGGELPEVTEAENGSLPQVVDGKVVYTPPNYILGTGGTYTLYAASWVDGVLIGGFDLKERDAIFFTPATREDKTAMENADIFISTSDTNWQVVTFEAATTPTTDIVLKYFIVRGW